MTTQDGTKAHSVAVVDDMRSHGDRVAEIVRSYGVHVVRYNSQGNWATMIDETRNAAIDGHRVINVSTVGGDEITKGMVPVTREHGALVVCAARKVDGAYTQAPQYPAYMAGLLPFVNNAGRLSEYDHVISVGSCNASGGSRSASDPKHVTIFVEESAPSWAAAHVSAACAKLFDILGDWSLVRLCLVNGARKNSQLEGNCESGGFLDLKASLALAHSMTGTLPPAELPPEETTMPEEIEWVGTTLTDGIIMQVDGHEPNIDGRRDESFGNLFEDDNSKWLKRDKKALIHLEVENLNSPDETLLGFYLTSANDAPERDPVFLRINEKTYVVPTFSQRHQTQLIVVDPVSLPITVELESKGPYIQLRNLGVVLEPHEQSEPEPETEPTLEERIAALETRVTALENR